MKAALVEREDVGGVHVNLGSIPTKALVSSVGILKKV
jgi:pyruvate/2-oxoglutarate dehydrogenase complex dihydrolipoamide dehydrogenase (E3) component